MVAIGAAIRIAQALIKAGKGIAGFTASQNSIIQRFPPNYRPYVKDFLTGTSIVQGGQIISGLIHDEFNGFSPKIPSAPSGRQQQKYSSTGSNRRGSGYKRFQRSSNRRFCYPRRYKQRY